MTEHATHATFLAPDLLDDPDDPDGPGGPDGHDAEAVGDDDDGATDDDAQKERADTAEAVPPGTRLASALAEAVAAHGWRVAYRWTTPYGHAFDCERTGARYDVELRLLDPEAARWLVWATPRTGLLRRLFKRPVADPAEHGLLLTHLDAILSADPRVSALQWTREAAAPAPAP